MNDAVARDSPLARAFWTNRPGDTIGGSIIVAILGLSIGLDTWQEGRASTAAELLSRSVAIKAEVLRDRRFVQLEVEQVVPGDVLRVRAGDVVPADGLLLTASALTVGEAALTGEPYPAEKRCGSVESADPADASNAVFRGSVVHTGEGVVLVAATGRTSLFGRAASALVEVQAPSPFQRDLHAFGLLTARLTIALIVVVLAAHMVVGRLRAALEAAAGAEGWRLAAPRHVGDAAQGDGGGNAGCVGGAGGLHRSPLEIVPPP
jgi:Mg2+-importing ATPase